MMLNKDVSVEMTMDRSIRVVNHRHRSVAATNRIGDLSCIHHQSAKIYHDGGVTEASIYWQRRVRLSAESIVFASGMSCYELSPGDGLTQKSHKFQDLSRDMSVTVLFTSRGYGPHLVELLEALVHNAHYDYSDDGSVKVEINKCLIKQAPNGDVTVSSDDYDKFIRVSPDDGSVWVHTNFCEMSVQMDYNVKIQRGACKMSASYNGLVVTDGIHDSGFTSNRRPFLRPVVMATETLIQDGKRTSCGLDDEQLMNEYKAAEVSTSTLSLLPYETTQSRPLPVECGQNTFVPAADDMPGPQYDRPRPIARPYSAERAPNAYNRQEEMAPQALGYNRYFDSQGMPTGRMQQQDQRQRMMGGENGVKYSSIHHQLQRTPPPRPPPQYVAPWRKRRPCFTKDEPRVLPAAAYQQPQQDNMTSFFDSNDFEHDEMRYHRSMQPGGPAGPFHHMSDHRQFHPRHDMSRNRRELAGGPRAPMMQGGPLHFEKRSSRINFNSWYPPPPPPGWQQNRGGGGAARGKRQYKLGRAHVYPPPGNEDIKKRFSGYVKPASCGGPQPGSTAADNSSKSTDTTGLCSTITTPERSSLSATEEAKSKPVNTAAHSEARPASTEQDGGSSSTANKTYVEVSVLNKPLSKNQSAEKPVSENPVGSRSKSLSHISLTGSTNRSQAAPTPADDSDEGVARVHRLEADVGKMSLADKLSVDAVSGAGEGRPLMGGAAVIVREVRSECNSVKRTRKNIVSRSEMRK